MIACLRRGWPAGRCDSMLALHRASWGGGGECVASGRLRFVVSRPSREDFNRQILIRLRSIGAGFSTPLRSAQMTERMGHGVFVVSRRGLAGVGGIPGLRCEMWGTQLCWRTKRPVAGLKDGRNYAAGRIGAPRVLNREGLRGACCFANWVSYGGILYFIPIYSRTGGGAYLSIGRTVRGVSPWISSSP